MNSVPRLPSLWGISSDVVTDLTIRRLVCLYRLNLYGRDSDCFSRYGDASLKMALPTVEQLYNLDAFYRPFRDSRWRIRGYKGKGRDWHDYDKKVLKIIRGTKIGDEEIIQQSCKPSSAVQTE